MKNEVRIQYLRRVLFVKVILTLFLWGLPAFAAPTTMLSFFKLPIPVEPIYLRLFGGTVIAWGVAYWYAYRDPVRNVAIIKAGVIDNALGTIAVIWFGIMGLISSLFIWISGLLTGLFFLSFLILMPRQVEDLSVQPSK